MEEDVYKARLNVINTIAYVLAEMVADGDNGPLEQEVIDNLYLAAEEIANELKLEVVSVNGSLITATMQTN